MQFGPAGWPFLPNEFECIQSVWLFFKKVRLALFAQHHRWDRVFVHHVLEQNVTSNSCNEANMDDQLLSILIGKTCSRVSSLPFINIV